MGEVIHIDFTVGPECELSEIAGDLNPAPFYGRKKVIDCSGNFHDLFEEYIELQAMITGVLAKIDRLNEKALEIAERYDV